MFIKNITLNNFRIYKGTQSISFEKDAYRNVFIVSGNNGYGKTSFLTSLIWCLYGKNMQEVDNSYKTTIIELGGYKKYMQSCINQSALSDDQTFFHVNITFSDVSVPGFTYNEVSVQRKYDVISDQEKLSILIDGQQNELVQEIGQEIFIHDFILPKEIAKFFFFDAEKNVSLAEAQSISDKRNLSKAYSEILGIKKYEELKNNLLDLRLRYRKNSAQEIDAEKITKLESEIGLCEKLKIHTEDKIKELTEQKEDIKLKVDRLQEKLIREGSTISLEQIRSLQAKRKSLVKEYEGFRADFNELMELAPFAIAGHLMIQVEEQIKAEVNLQAKQLPKEMIAKKINLINEELKKIKPIGSPINDKTKNLYLKAVAQLLQKHLLEAEENKIVKAMHHMENEDISHFNAIMENLRSTYRIRLADASRKIKNNRIEFNKVIKQLTEAEAKESDKVIENYRNEKNVTEEKLLAVENELHDAYKNLGTYEHQYAVKKKVIEEMSRKIQLQEKYQEKDAVAARLIQELDAFLLKIKNEKRVSLEQRILEGLNALMHKNNFITRVQVIIKNDIIDIELFNGKEQIVKENLSKGEQQLYVTALLKALVEESNIQFPVFIDSPMQKYDALHASKIISEFYPTISKQVVLFPLMHKEMTIQEYELLLPYTKAAYLIENTREQGSFLTKVQPNQLFNQAIQVIAYA